MKDRMMKASPLYLELNGAVELCKANARIADGEVQARAARLVSLEERVAVLSEQAESTGTFASTATDNFVMAKSTDQALASTRRVAREALRDGYEVAREIAEIFAGLHEVLCALRDALPEVEELAELVGGAVSKEGMPAFVFTSAGQAAAAGRASLSAALSAFTDAAEAMSLARQASVSALALPAALQRVENAMREFSKPSDSAMEGVPGTLELVLALVGTNELKAHDVLTSLESILRGSITASKESLGSERSDGSATLKEGHPPRVSKGPTSQTMTIGGSSLIQAFGKLTARPTATPGQDGENHTSHSGQAGMLERFELLFHVFGHARATALHALTSARGDLIAARQALSEQQTVAHLASEAARAAENAVLR